MALHAHPTAIPLGIHGSKWAVVGPESECSRCRTPGWLAGRNIYPDVRLRRVVIFDRPAHHLVEEARPPSYVVVSAAATVNSPGCCWARSAPR